jgi:hypothetical protein
MLEMGWELEGEGSKIRQRSRLECHDLGEEAFGRFLMKPRPQLKD